MNELKFIIIPVICALVSQVLKCIIESIKYHKIDLERLLDGAGGMPSSHSALVTSITTCIAISEGLSSPLFAICLIFSFVVVYDAMGVRYETGKQAEILNQLTQNIDLKKQVQKLKEKVGHKPIEVLAGIILGIALTYLLYPVI